MARTTPSALGAVPDEGHGWETKWIFLGLTKGSSTVIVFIAVLFSFFILEGSMSTKNQRIVRRMKTKSLGGRRKWVTKTHLPPLCRAWLMAILKRVLLDRRTFSLGTLKQRRVPYLSSSFSFRVEPGPTDVGGHLTTQTSSLPWRDVLQKRSTPSSDALKECFE